MLRAKAIYFLAIIPLEYGHNNMAFTAQKTRYNRLENYLRDTCLRVP